LDGLCRKSATALLSIAIMPKPLRAVRLAFRETHLAHFGGMIPLQRFCNWLKLRWRIQKDPTIPRRNANYLPSGSKNVLVLPHDYHYQKEFTNALKTIDRLRLP
jgi:hypothetical protein